MIDIAADLREQAARYTAEADAALASAPAPLPDLETARAQILQQLADVDRRIAARQTAERRHAHLMAISQKLAALAAQHGAEMTAPAPAAEALTAALRAEGERMPARPPLSPETARWDEDGASEPSPQRLEELPSAVPPATPVAGPAAQEAALETRPQEVPPPGGPFPAAEPVVDRAGTPGPQDGVNGEDEPSASMIPDSRRISGICN